MSIPLLFVAHKSKSSFYKFAFKSLPSFVHPTTFECSNPAIKFSLSRTKIGTRSSFRLKESVETFCSCIDAVRLTVYGSFFFLIPLLRVLPFEVHIRIGRSTLRRVCRSGIDIRCPINLTKLDRHSAEFGTQPAECRRRSPPKIGNALLFLLQKIVEYLNN